MHDNKNTLGNQTIEQGSGQCNPFSCGFVLEDIETCKSISTWGKNTVWNCFYSIIGKSRFFVFFDARHDDERGQVLSGSLTSIFEGDIYIRLVSYVEGFRVRSNKAETDPSTLIQPGCLNAGIQRIFGSGDATLRSICIPIHRSTLSFHLNPSLPEGILIRIQAVTRDLSRTFGSFGGAYRRTCLVQANSTSENAAYDEEGGKGRIPRLKFELLSFVIPISTLGSCLFSLYFIHAATEEKGLPFKWNMAFGLLFIGFSQWGGYLLL